MGKERIMSKMLKTHQKTIGNLVIALLFVGGCIFLLTGSWDTSVSEAVSSCCGGKTTEAVLAGGCCGGGEADTVSDSESCKCVSTTTSCSTDNCDPADNDTCKDATPKRACPAQKSDGTTSCQNTSTDGSCLGNSCDRNICTRADQCAGDCDET